MLLDAPARHPGRSARDHLLAQDDVMLTTRPNGAMEVVGLDLAKIGDRAAEAALPLHELTLVRPSLEEAYIAHSLPARTSGPAGR